MNKNGWGLVTELIIMLLFVVLLVYAIFGLNQLGLIRNMDSALGPGIKPDLIISGKTTNYAEVENNIILGAQNYINDKFSNVIENEEIIRINHLVKNGYVATIRDTKNKVCSGYVKVTKNAIDLSYSPYLKCSNYETFGYESEYDW